jgi:hypothetical protein
MAVSLAASMAPEVAMAITGIKTVSLDVNFTMRRLESG